MRETGPDNGMNEVGSEGEVPRYPESMFPNGEVPAVDPETLEEIMAISARARIEGHNAGSLATLTEAYAKGAAQQGEEQHDISDDPTV